MMRVKNPSRIASLDAHLVFPNILLWMVDLVYQTCGNHRENPITILNLVHYCLKEMVTGEIFFKAIAFRGNGHCLSVARLKV